MTFDNTALARQVADLEDKLHDIRLALETPAPALDALADLADLAPPDGQTWTLAAGYTPLSTGLGLFLPDGAAQVRVGPAGPDTALRITAAPDAPASSAVIFQLNLPFAAMRGRRCMEFQAIWDGAALTQPSLELRLLGHSGIIRRETMVPPPGQHAGGGSLRVPIRISDSLSRSESLHEMQVCLNCGPGLPDAGFTTLRVV